MIFCFSQKKNRRWTKSKMRKTREVFNFAYYRDLEMLDCEIYMGHVNTTCRWWIDRMLHLLIHLERKRPAHNLFATILSRHWSSLIRNASSHSTHVDFGLEVEQRQPFLWGLRSKSRFKFDDWAIPNYPPFHLGVLHSSMQLSLQSILITISCLWQKIQKFTLLFFWF